MNSEAFTTAMFYHYIRLRVWMEEAPRQETWPWYGVLPVWAYITVLIA